MKTTSEKADFVIRLLTFISIVVGGGWALYLYKQAGSNDWTNNITLETQVLPYHDNLRLLVVHVKSKNPRNYGFELKAKLGDSYTLKLRKLAMDKKVGTVFDEEDGALIQEMNLMPEDGEYQYLPGAEMDDMRSLVLPVDTIVVASAEMDIHNGGIDKDGKPDTDFISASTVVLIKP